MLIEAGVPDTGAFRALGPVGAFRSLRFHFGRRVSVNFVYALACAVDGCAWADLGATRKAALREAARRTIGELEGQSGAS
jgi:hypothetical protein